MKTRARLVLERRFRQWAAGKTLRTLSAAALLGLTLSSMPAEAQTPSVCDYGGTGGPSVRVFINNGETPVADLVADPATGLVDLAGTFTENPDGTGATFTIAGAADGFFPTAFVDSGTGVSLLVVTELFIIYGGPDAVPGNLRLVVSSENALNRNCPGGSHTFAATMDGAVLADTGAVSMKAEASISDRETTIVVNRVPGDQEASNTDTPSLVAGVPGSPLKPGGIFSDAVVEDSQCGDLEFFNCTFRLRNTIEFTFANPGDVIYSAGSFKSAALEDAVENLGGATGASVVLGSTGVPFDRFSAAVATQPRLGTFEVGALLKLGPLSDGLNVVNEPFRLRVGAFTGELASHSFVERRFFGVKFYVFDGTIDDGSATGSRFKAVITPLLGRTFSLLAIGRGANLVPGTTLVDVTIGSDNGGGSAKVVKIPR